jgi:hypothetical protein
LHREDGAFISAVSERESEFSLTCFDRIALKGYRARCVGNWGDAKAVEETGGLEVFANAFEGGLGVGLPFEKGGPSRDELWVEAVESLDGCRAEPVFGAGVDRDGDGNNVVFGLGFHGGADDDP